jgi:SpoVK/Ycf46/Vps4 family AAA+-type ATPase
MADSIRDLLFGSAPTRALVEPVTPRRTFDDVVLPPETLDALNHALALVRKHDLIFRDWGLGERHSTGLGLAFHFAGPPGTGKTICAEALACALGRDLLVVRYAELESRWVGQTGKHVTSVFRAAERQDAVLFFDEADAIAGRRFTTATVGYEREANAVVNVLLQELDRFDGVVIFATNLAASIDPAFERRIRTHVLFNLPGVDERERIWRVQLHPRRTPLAEDVSFRALAEAFPRSGGDIKNAVLKAAELASLEPGPDALKRIHQRHFEQGMREVISADAVMSQSLFDQPAGGTPPRPEAWDRLAESQDRIQGELGLVIERLETIEQAHAVTLDRLGSEQAKTDRLRRLAERRILSLAAAALIIAIIALAIALLR